METGLRRAAGPLVLGPMLGGPLVLDGGRPTGWLRGPKALELVAMPVERARVYSRRGVP